MIISYQADRRVATALQSIMRQDVVAEIVVVNSGAESLAGRLGAHEEAVTLVESSTRLFVGGARNVGVLFSRAPIVAFLASDCLAAPGWLQRRLVAHARGNDLVASALLPAPDRGGRISRTAWASFILTHTGRMPETPPEVAARYGLSYRRSLFGRHGFFDAGLRVGEDTDFNRRCVDSDRPVWDPAIVTFHHYPQALFPAAVEQFRRGRMAALHARAMLGRSPLKHVFHAVYRGFVVNDRLAQGYCSPQARHLSVRMLILLLFGFNLLGVLSACFRGRRTPIPVLRAMRPADPASDHSGIARQSASGRAARMRPHKSPESAQLHGP